MTYEEYKESLDALNHIKDTVEMEIFKLNSKYAETLDFLYEEDASYYDSSNTYRYGGIEFLTILEVFVDNGQKKYTCDITLYDVNTSSGRSIDSIEVTEEELTKIIEQNHLVKEEWNH